MADTLATVADLAAQLQLDEADLNPTTAALLLETATAVVQAAAGGQRIVQVVDDEVVLDLDEHDGGPYLTLPQRPVTAVSSVLVGATTVTDWLPQFRRSRLWRSSGWRGPAGWYRRGAPSTVTVVYTHGYPPDDQRIQFARAAVLGLAAGAYSSPAGAKSERIDDYAVTYDTMASQLVASPALEARLRQQYGRPPGSVPLVAGRSRW
ncbi:hypothetical protein ACIBCR_16405 [Micromonospora echinospora]|uniref:hypothetical protein n=1 Tax=Micromonospora echinospora TaxID=1877 RepID=UPI00378BAD36